MGTKVIGGDVKSDSVDVHMESVGGDALPSLNAEIVLVSTGRRPYTSGLDLENIGIQVDKFGRIP